MNRSLNDLLSLDFKQRMLKDLQDRFQMERIRADMRIEKTLPLTREKLNPIHEPIDLQPLHETFRLQERFGKSRLPMEDPVLHRKPDLDLREMNRVMDMQRKFDRPLPHRDAFPPTRFERPFQPEPPLRREVDLRPLNHTLDLQKKMF